MSLSEIFLRLKGSNRSGNYGHSGNPPNRGGSSPGGGHGKIGVTIDTPTEKIKKLARIARGLEKPEKITKIGNIPIHKYVTDIKNNKGSKGFFLDKENRVIPVVHQDHWTTARAINKNDINGEHFGSFNPNEYDSPKLYKNGVITGSWVPKNYLGQSEVNLHAHTMDKQTVSRIKKLIKSGVIPTTDRMSFDENTPREGYFSSGSLHGISTDDFLKLSYEKILDLSKPSDLMKK